VGEDSNEESNASLLNMFDKNPTEFDTTVPASSSSTPSPNSSSPLMSSVSPMVSTKKRKAEYFTEEPWHSLMMCLGSQCLAFSTPCLLE
ncbi:hypothetical protein BGX27_000513, partial [Mortierella sp. AM989]